MRYGLRSLLVEPVRWTGRDRAGWSARLRKAAGEPPAVPGHVSVDAEGNGRINTRIGELPVVPRQWIVRERGRLLRYGTEEFEATSEAAHCGRTRRCQSTPGITAFRPAG